MVFHHAPFLGRGRVTNNNKSKILEGAVKCSGDSKRFRSNNYENVDAVMILWFKLYSWESDLRIDGDFLFTQMQFSNKFQYTKLPGSSWINRWKKFLGIGKILKSGVAGRVDMDVVEEWRTGELKRILETYSQRDIYKCDEAGLFWQMLGLPERSLGFIGEKQSGRKQLQLGLPS